MWGRWKQIASLFTAPDFCLGCCKAFAGGPRDKVLQGLEAYFSGVWWVGGCWYGKEMGDRRNEFYALSIIRPSLGRRLWSRLGGTTDLCSPLTSPLILSLFSWVAWISEGTWHQTQLLFEVLAPDITNRRQFCFSFRILVMSRWFYCNTSFKILYK